MQPSPTDNYDRIEKAILFLERSVRRSVFPWLSIRLIGKTAKTGESVFMKPGKVENFDAGKCSSLVCTSGTIWITQEGDAEDYVLEQGEGFRPRCRGRIVAWALTDSQIEVQGR